MIIGISGKSQSGMIRNKCTESELFELFLKERNTKKQEETIQLSNSMAV